MGGLARLAASMDRVKSLLATALPVLSVPRAQATKATTREGVSQKRRYSYATSTVRNLVMHATVDRRRWTSLSAVNSPSKPLHTLVGA